MLENQNKSDSLIELKEENYEMVERENIEDTPFTVITVKETGEHFACLGKYRITEPVKTKAECIKEVKKVTWNRIVQVILLMHETLGNDKIINLTQDRN